jgi:hypothetical protein
MVKKLVGILVVIPIIIAPLISSLSTFNYRSEVNNNSISECIEVYDAYGYVSYYPGGEIGLYGFELDGPKNFTFIGSGGISGGACFVPPCYVYFSEYSTGILWALDVLTLDFSTIGGGGTGLNSLDYDDESGKLYGVGSYGLYEINVETGEHTYIGSWGTSYMIIAIAINNGICYGHDILNDAIYIIDLDTADLTLLGYTGINCNYDQDMAFNKDEDILYLAAYTTKGQLYICNTTNGNCTLVGDFPEGLYMSAFAITYGNVPPYVPCDFYPEDGEDDVPLNVTLCWKGGDYNSEDIVTYDVYFGNSFPPIKKSSNQTETCHKIPYDLNRCKEYFWQIVAWDNHGLCTAGPILTFNTFCGPQPPSAPIIKGPIYGIVGVEYVYTFNSTDDNNDDLIYMVDWGDKSPIEQVGPSPPGIEVNASHTWNKRGAYIIKAIAKDVHGLIGPPGFLEVTMPKNKMMNNYFFFKFLERFPILRILFNIGGDKNV